MNTLKLLLATFTIAFAYVPEFAQHRLNRPRPAPPGMVRTVRVEERQLRVVTYVQHGVMVSTNISDDQGRPLESAEYLPGGNPDVKTTSTYDENGNEIEYASYTHDELSSRSTTLYDSRNRKVEQLSFSGSGQQRSRFVYQYDNRGRQIALEVQPDGEMIRRSVTTFNSRGKELERTEYNANGTYESRYVYRYDNAGNQIAELHYYKLDGKVRSSRKTYVYDRNGEVIQYSLYFDGALETKTTYKRGGGGYPIEIIETDTRNRVVKKQLWSHEFDAEGNPTRSVLSEWTAKAPDVPLQPTFEFRRVFENVTRATFLLWSAAREGDAARVAVLLSQGADVNAHHPDGGTPLIKAATRGHREVVQPLLKAGARVDEKDAEGWTALMWSAEYGHLETVDLLLKAGANPNARTNIGGVAIMPTTLMGHIEVLKLLIEKGADVNAATDIGATALMYATKKADLVVLKFLIDSGADVNAKTMGGETALSIALAENKNEAAELLRKAGAK